MNRDKMVTKMSLTPACGAVEYEFSSKSLQNLTSAMCRQLSGRVVASRADKEAFVDMSKRLWDYYEKLVDFKNFSVPDFYNYPEKFTGSKRDTYLKNIIAQLAGADIPENWSGVAMVKSGEVYTDTQRLPIQQFDTTKNRPRMIANPSSKTLGLAQAISSHVQHYLSERIPEFVCGLNLKALAQRIGKCAHLNRVISIDGSAFDSN